MLYKRKRSTAVAMCAVISATSLCFGLAGCTRERPKYYYDADLFGDFANDFMLTMLGSDVINWNALSVTPEQSYGYERYGEPSWYSYSPLSKSDVSAMGYVFGLYKSEMNKFNFADLSATDKATYRTMQNLIADYSALYGSKYAVDFNLLGGSYINSSGGYVADFTTNVECFTFRNETDVEDLLKIIESTKSAFGTYLVFARDRKNAGYPLYDYTLCEMQNYLNDVAAQGRNYYLYDFLYEKIDAANFLSTAQKQEYKTEYSAALTDSFMAGVKTLSQGLDEYKGNVEVTEKSYFAASGAVGKEYYRWLFGNKTGIRNANLDTVSDEMIDAVFAALDKKSEVEAAVAELETTNKAAFDDFNAYKSGEKALFDLTTPQEIVEYLKVAAKDIVPDLDTVPQIGFKYMDETVASRTTTLAYYLLSPLDEKNSVESITINPVTATEDPNELLLTMAHEGYPGHLYAHVRSKENGTSLLSEVLGSLAFSEGWAVYVEFALLDRIAAESEDVAVQLYCDYEKYDYMFGYYNMVYNDLLINYYGATVTDLVESGNDEDLVRTQIELLMELPTLYVPYGYGTYVVANAHDKAKAELGEAYSEVDYNGQLLSEGKMSLPRVGQITDEYISSVKSRK